MSKFHITITNNETGEILHDNDTAAIIGAYAFANGAYAIGLTACNGITLMATINTAEHVVKRLLEEHPMSKAIYGLIKAAENTNLGPSMADADDDAEITDDTDN